MKIRFASIGAISWIFFVGLLWAQGGGDGYRRLSREIFKELIEINTTDSVGSTTDAARAMKARLDAAGIPSEVLAPHARKGNLVARLAGSGARKPVLLLAHLDVVEARLEDWTTDPFKFVEKDGYFYGRGTTDDKAMAAILTAVVLRLKKENYKPDRDLILALTADEEGGNYNGVSFLLQNHRPKIDAAFCINEGGGGVLRQGRRVANEFQTSEKTYQSFLLEVRNPGGHSSLPTKENAIYRLAEGLVRLSRFDSPFSLNETTRGYFEAMSNIELAEIARDMKAILGPAPAPAAVARLSQVPYYNAMMRTTCVATRLDAGHADNALPQTARAIYNCRMLPGMKTAEVLATLEKVLNDPQIKISPVQQADPGPSSPLSSEVFAAAKKITEEMWPGVPVVPVMSTGATDGLYLRKTGIPTYGVDGIFGDVDDIRAHGKDERLLVRSFDEGAEFLYRLIKSLTSP